MLLNISLILFINRCQMELLNILVCHWTIFWKENGTKKKKGIRIKIRLTIDGYKRDKQFLNGLKYIPISIQI